MLEHHLNLAESYSPRLVSMPLRTICCFRGGIFCNDELERDRLLRSRIWCTSDLKQHVADRAPAGRMRQWRRSRRCGASKWGLLRCTLLPDTMAGKHPFNLTGPGKPVREGERLSTLCKFTTAHHMCRNDNQAAAGRSSVSRQTRMGQATLFIPCHAGRSTEESQVARAARARLGGV